MTTELTAEPKSPPAAELTPAAELEPQGTSRPVGRQSAVATMVLRWLPYVGWVVFAALYSTLSLTRYALLSTPSWDNAIFQQAIAAYAHLQEPIVTIKGPGYNILGDHFSPILAVLAPVYRLFPHAQTLLVAQAVLITASVVPITRIAVRRLGTAAGIAVLVAYALSFGIQSAVYTDFHEVAFAAPLVAFAGEAFLQRRWQAVVWWSLPLLLVKEDLGVTVAVVGVVLLISGARRLGLVLAGCGIGAFALVVFLVIPWFNATGTFDYWGAVSFGSAGPGALQTFFTGWDDKGVTLLLTFGITGFLCLRSPWVLVGLPTLGWRWIGDKSEYWGTNWHYSLILMPIVFIALIDAISRLRTSGPQWLRRYSGHVPTAAVSVALVLVLQFPLDNLVKAQTYEPAPDAAAAAAAMALIPPGASVETNMGLITHLVNDHRVYWIGTLGSVAPDYVLIDTHTTYDAAGLSAYTTAQHPGVPYRQIYDHGGYLVAQRSG